PPQGDAARPLRRGPRRRRRGHLERRRLLQGQPHPGQALRGVQGASRREPGRLQGADPDAPGGRPVIPELGYGAAIVALVLALWGAVTAALGARTGRPALLLSAQHAALAVFVLVTACFALLTYAFLTFDFSVRYVATNTNLGTPFYYRITGVWGALEGSIILWTWMLGLYTLIVILRHREGARELYPWVLTVMLGVLAFFLLVITVAAPPFARQAPVPADGRGLNPLLEDPVMIQERRRMLKLWNISLVILTFGLTLFGTFLTRSGVIASVHAFTQGTIGAFFLSFLALVLLTALGLLAVRWDALHAQGELDSI